MVYITSPGPMSICLRIVSPETKNFYIKALQHDKNREILNFGEKIECFPQISYYQNSEGSKLNFKAIKLPTIYS